MFDCSGVGIGTVGIGTAGIGRVGNGSTSSSSIDIGIGSIWWRWGYRRS